MIRTSGAELIAHRPKQGELLRVIERRRLPCGSGEHQPMRAVVDQVSGKGSRRRLVHRAVLGERVTIAVITPPISGIAVRVQEAF